MSGKCTLKKYLVDENIFNSILLKWNHYIVDTPDITKYFKGYSNKKTIYYNTKDTIIIQTYRLSGIVNIEDYSWKQLIVSKNQNLNFEGVKSDTDGNTAYRVVKGWLHKYYTDEEIEECLNSHTSEYDYKKKQVHYLSAVNSDKIVRFTNSYYYDINGAHCDALCEIFPKAKELFIEKYKQRKRNPVIKSYFNYYVGFLTRKGHRGTYNWIVQRTTRIIEKFMSETVNIDSSVIYANTDGIIIRNPSKVYPGSKKLGEFKLEYSGDIYLYKGSNYYVIQYGDKLVGNVLRCVRKNINLSKGETVSYDKIYSPLYKSYAADNVKINKIEVIDYE